ncbi:MAG: hypothetical protein H7Y31_07625 [Chitinophagaceae bacterium]|nr:hypothetical protein [Chitinophagaceae bacterium]
MRRVMMICLIINGLMTQAQTTDQTVGGDRPVYNDISGTPLFYTAWKDGIIRFSSGRVANQFKLKFDCVQNQVMLQFEGRTFSSESSVKEFVMFPKGFKVKDSVLFRKGFPATGKATSATFFQVLAQGNYTLLLLHIKNITEDAQYASKVINRQFSDELAYYIFKDGVMLQLPTERSSMSSMFPGKEEIVREFIANKQLRFRDPGDYQLLVEYVNSL